eukprot:gene9911-2096_t
MSKKTVPKSSLYTGTGDGGTSQLYTGQKRSKTDSVFECLGNLDELNSHFGLVREYVKDDPCLDDIKSDLYELQCLLLELGTHVASPSIDPEKSIPFDQEGLKLRWLETRIDELDACLPPLKNFILPSGGLGAAQMHLARCVCRRTERTIVKLYEASGCSASSLKFINRLSDYFFCAARTCAFRSGSDEVVFQSKRGQRNITIRQSKQGRASVSMFPSLALLCGLVGSVIAATCITVAIQRRS